jgi:nucleoside-diphosphate-sugar epimerase
VPAPVLQTAFLLLGKPEYGKRLFGSLQVDISKTQELLGWVPPVGLDVALKQTARHFLAAP